MKNALFRTGCGIVAIALVSLSMVAQAQWKWRDAQGRVQYSDQPPPPGVAAKDVLQSPIAAPPPRVVAPASAPAAAAPGKAASTADPALEAKRKQAQQEAEAKRKAEEAQQTQVKAQNCDRARDYMRTLDSGIRVARTNAKGEREIMDDATRAREAESTRQIMQSQCR
jgi:Domain of unknown function (DUF4124)